MRRNSAVIRRMWTLLIGGMLVLGCGLEVLAGQASETSPQPAASASEALPPLPMGGRPSPPVWTPTTGWQFVLPHPGTSWHAGYAHPAWGLPVAVVVPPNARFESKYQWGVGGTQSVMIRHQFSRDYPGPGQIFRHRLMPTPRWPSHTDQLGVYPVRGPW